MSSLADESQQPQPTEAPSAQPDVQNTDSGLQNLARYTLHVPVRDNTGKEIPHVLANVRKMMTAAGFHGRTVIRRAQGDWMDLPTEEMDLIMVDAPNAPEILEAMKNIASGVKQLAGQEAVYLTVQPIQGYLI